mgnify:FL=1
MKMIADVQEAEEKLSQEQKQNICEKISALIHSLKKLFSLPQEQVQKLEDKCIKHLLGKDVEALRKELNTVLTEQKARIVQGQMALEKFQLATSIVLITSNLYDIFSGLENVKLKNKVV